MSLACPQDGRKYIRSVVWFEREREREIREKRGRKREMREKERKDE